MTYCPLTNKRCDRPDICNRDMRCVDADEEPCSLARTDQEPAHG